MQFRDRRKAAEEQYKKDNGIEDVWTSAQLAALPNVRPLDGDSWGLWTYRRNNLVLEFRDEIGQDEYEVDLERCATAAEMLDWIFQVAAKEWCDAETIGFLLMALDDLMDPQNNICSGGENNKPFNVKVHLAVHTDAADS